MVAVPSIGPEHVPHVATPDSGYGSRGPRVCNDRAGEVGRTLNVKDFDLDRIFGEEGVQMIKSSAYDVVFMDLAMPNKNGLLAIREILEEFPGTKIVAVSGKDTEMLERALEYGALRALTKPVTPKQAQDTVEKLLRGRPTGGWDDVLE